MATRALFHSLYELGPIFIFFIAGQLMPFMPAVGVFVAATTLSLLIGWTWHRHLALLPSVSALVTIGAGVLTIHYNQPHAIILADTVWYWGLAVAVAIGFFTTKHFLEYMFDETFAVQKIGWQKHAERWLIVLILAGAANEYIRLTMTPEFWIDYRFTKVIVLSAFGFYQFTLARRYRIEGESNSWGVRMNEPT